MDFYKKLLVGGGRSSYSLAIPTLSLDLDVRVENGQPVCSINRETL